MRLFYDLCCLSTGRDAQIERVVPSCGNSLYYLTVYDVLNDGALLSCYFGSFADLPSLYSALKCFGLSWDVKRSNDYPPFFFEHFDVPVKEVV